MNQSNNYVFKIVIIGDTNVGKTKIIERLTKNKFTESISPTIGVDFSTMTFKLDSDTCKAQIWDTAGQERYHAIISAYYRGAVVVYDITDTKSFDNVFDEWLKSIKKACDSNISILLIGNKSDLKSDREIETDKAKSMAISEEMEFFETSAKSGKNVYEAFQNFISKIYEKEKVNNTLKKRKEVRREDLKGKQLSLAKSEEKKKWWCF
ncbi:RAA2D [Hepatospora eriocheir]|uniref:RAA2D n=1 Tax=Hepatospora eriocheir TaxID=1081669 RepID=A0A1X0QHR2_9MICR|nr:RAA2D [Hepatospora eriocheir]